MLKFAFAFAMSVVLSLPAHAAEESYVLKSEPLTVNVTTFNGEMVRFESCENGRCQILGEGTGVYRSRDLIELARHLEAEFNTFSKKEFRFVKGFDLAFALSVLTYLFLNPVAERYAYDWAYSVEGTGAIAISRIVSFGIIFGWIPYRALVRKLWYESYSEPISALNEALDRRFKTYNEVEFREQIETLETVLKKDAKPMSQCELDLIDQTPGNATQTDVPGPASGAETSTSAP